MAPEAGATPADGILSDFVSVVAPQWPDLRSLLRDGVLDSRKISVRNSERRQFLKWHTCRLLVLVPCFTRSSSGLRKKVASSQCQLSAGEASIAQRARRY
jgi:hypothetical protein